MEEKKYLRLGFFITDGWMLEQHEDGTTKMFHSREDAHEFIIKERKENPYFQDFYANAIVIDASMSHDHILSEVKRLKTKKVKAEKEGQ